DHGRNDPLRPFRSGRMYHLWYFRRSAAEKKGPLKNKNRREIFTGGKGYAVRGLAIYIDYPGRILCFSLFFSSLCNEKNRGGNPGNTTGPYPEPDAASARPKPGFRETSGCI